MSSFAQGLAQGLQFGYNFGTRYGARKDIEELQKLKDEGVINNTQNPEVSRSTGLVADSAQSQQLAAQDAEFGLAGDQMTTAGLTANPNMTPEDYQFMGENFTRAPNVFDQQRVYQNRLADVYGARGMFAQQAQAQNAAMAAEGQSMGLQRDARLEDMQRQRLQLAQERGDREQQSLDSRLQTEHLQRTAAQIGIDLNTLKLDQFQDVERINGLYFDYLGGNKKSLDPLLEAAMPLYNQNKEDNHQLVKKKDGMYVQFEGKDGEPGQTVRASVFFEGLAPQRQASLLEWSQRYAIAARTGNFKGLDDLRKNAMMANYYQSRGQTKLSDYMQKMKNLDYTSARLSPDQFALTIGFDPDTGDPETLNSMYQMYSMNHALKNNPPTDDNLSGGSSNVGGLGGQMSFIDDIVVPGAQQFSSDVMTGLGLIGRGETGVGDMFSLAAQPSTRATPSDAEQLSKDITRIENELTGGGEFGVISADRRKRLMRLLEERKQELQALQSRTATPIGRANNARMQGELGAYGLMR